MSPLLAATDLAAREHRLQAALHRRAAGEQVWEPPEVIGYRRWIEARWARQWPTEQLLNQTQLLALWRSVIDADARPVPLLAPQACARLALAADQLARRHHIDPERTPAYTDEHQAFRRWRRTVDERLRALDALTPADLPDQLHRTPVPTWLHPGAWTQLPPAEQALFTRLGLPPPASPPPLPTLAGIAHPDREQQFRALALRVAAELSQPGDPGTPGPILLVVPDPEGARSLLEAALSDVLAPWRHQPGGAERLPWRWAQPPALARTPAAGFLSLLSRLDLTPAASADWHHLLLHPLLGDAEVRLAAARLERRLREQGWARIDLRSLAALAEPALALRLEGLTQALSQEPTRQLPGAWGLQFLARRTALGVAADPLDSLGFQTEQALRQACTRLAGLDRLLGPVRAGEAATWLAEYLAPPFQPRVEQAQPLLIGRPESLLGIPARLLLLADADTQSWSTTRAVNPFLPLAAQRAAGVPEAHPGTAAQAQEQRLRALLSLAHHSEVHLANQDSRGTPTLPCGWLATTTPAPPEQPPERSTTLAVTRLPDDDPVPPLDPIAEVLNASTGTFERVLTAPLLGLVVDRLDSTPLPPSPQGLPASVQGELLHAALAMLWDGLENRQTLLALGPEALVQRVEHTLDALLPKYLPERRYGPAWCLLERSRARDLLLAWLGHEQRRHDDFTVVEREHALKTDFAGLPVSLRLDRIDRVVTPSGPQTLLIDYKTGRSAEPRGWNADRLESPQLPLYAVLAQRLPALQPVGGVAFAHLKEGHPALSARTAWSEYLIDQAPPREDAQWPEQLAAWQTALELVARHLLDGHAGSDPRRLTRHYAPYRALLTDDADDTADETEP